jgi:Ca-activated chloride channel family protein
MKYRGTLFFIMAGLFFPAILGAAGASAFASASASAFASAFASQSGFSEEEDASPAGLNYIVPPRDVWLDAYIGQADYHYPVPQTDPFNVIPLTDIRDSTAYFLIGFKGKKENFGALPLMNLCFVIDTSAYMEQDEKLEWVKESFRAFVDQVRERDIVSVVVFADQAELLVSPTLIRNEADREWFSALIDSLEPGGGADMFQGMTLGYSQVAANYQDNYLNRVILLSGGKDGSGRSRAEFLDLSQWYNQQGIDISTVALGIESDVNLMTDIATVSEGAVRSILDYELMEQVFGSELDRLVVPAVWRLNLELTLAPGVRFREAWGYNYWIEGNVFHYAMGTLHHGDSKTLIAMADLEKPIQPGTALGTFSLLYTDTKGKSWRLGPFSLIPDSGVLQNRRVLTDPRIREAEGVITLGKSLMDVGSRVLAISQAQGVYNASRRIDYDGYYEPVEASESGVLRNKIAAELENCLTVIQSTWDYLAHISNNTEGINYVRELQILEDYEYAVNQMYGDYLSY